MGYTLILFIERVAVNPEDFHDHDKPQDSAHEPFDPGHVRPCQHEEEFTGSQSLRESINIESADHEYENKEMAQKSHVHAARPYVLLAALSVHSVFEGIAIGI